MLLTAFIVGILLLGVCGAGEKWHNQQILQMSYEEWREFKRTGRYPKRKK